MLIQIKNQSGETLYLNIGLIEAIFGLNNGGSEIIMTNGHRYTTLEAPNKLNERISLVESLQKI